MSGNKISFTTDSSGVLVSDLSNDIQLVDNYGDYNNLIMNSDAGWFEQTEYVIFKNELRFIKKNFLVVLKECKENKRLLDLKYHDLDTLVNNIQTSVIFFSTISGFLQATRVQFSVPDDVIAIISISISTYISLLLSISKYYKLDEMKEKIQVLREKFSLIHNNLDYQMDILGPWMNKHVWIHQDPKKKLSEWSILYNKLTEEYDLIIENKKDLVTEFEIIMDTKSRNYYHIKNRKLNYSNRIKLNEWDMKESDLEESIQKNTPVRASISLKHEELDNWDDEHSEL